MTPPAQGTAARARLLTRRCVANAGLLSIAALFALLIEYPPTRYRFYPLCPIHRYLGLDCPGCGATRALAALLHGNFTQAFRLNALFVVLLPVALAIAFETYRRAISARPFHWPRVPTPAVYTTLAAAALFTIARNLH